MTMQNLPKQVTDVIENSFISEFATVTKAGVPIDTPTYCFASDDLSLIGVATGIAYPAKAERARRNSKVGLLIEGMPGQPVISIRGRAAVRDADLQGNAIRYLSETGWEALGASAGVDWPVARKAVWYWTRIIIDIMPEEVLWWENADSLDSQPHVETYSIPSDFVSDPTPAGKTSPAPKWPQQPWQEVAQGAIARDAPAHLTLVDDKGFPLPMRVNSREFDGERFKLTLPRATPWTPSGSASLSFQGIENFIGEVATEGDVTWLTVERALPQLPMMQDVSEVLQPTDSTRDNLMARLKEECERRGQQIPTIPEQPPARTRLAQGRMERAIAYTAL